MAEEMMTKAAAMRGDGQMTMVEQAAKAIYSAWAAENEVTHTWDELTEAVAVSPADAAPTLHRMHRLAFAEARAALEAVREPTDFVLAAAHRNNHPRDIETWQTMIDAALSEADHG
ncbi:hypothetical protein [Antarcticirhabdus aurantiaca]|uniref:Uncharacterized protein n=1 Tax=Antarcticirhabdus aurantiaca TaxID=2606717 RepID=A0ACD4NK74_9HYPH|nr:hypothetical protein [Antarcticirhabdus aurantiaca]WAJ27122.1 hypothetical protein OXU80_20030 [Jeongeuplla avenae]